MMGMLLEGKRALVTGASRGIGSAIALELARCGADVIVHYAGNAACAQDIADQIAAMGRHVQILQADLSDPHACEGLIEKIGAVDILVLNASVQIRNPWEQINNEEFDKQMHINVRASLALIQACVPAMREQKWGRIVTVGSVQQYRPNTAMAVYAATKAAQRNLVMTLCAQLAGDGITINNIAPGAIETIRNVEALADAAYRAKIEKSIPVGFVGQAEDVAPAVLLLCSNEGRYITGTDFPIDGGMAIPFT